LSKCKNNTYIGDRERGRVKNHFGVEMSVLFNPRVRFYLDFRKLVKMKKKRANKLGVVGDGTTLVNP
jgi:hypothetical protein